VISVILYGRNDNYGYNLHKRAALSFNCIAEVLDPTDEILFVDYNTPDDFPTFPEAIRDTLTDKARALLRVLRVRAFVHERYKSRTRLVALEPIARNIAIRRSNPSNRWILSTNTDLIFVPQSDRSIGAICRDLRPNLYHAPRIELPETLWESFDRREPRQIIDTVRDWGSTLHLNEIVFGSETILYDGPGDFQLLPREDLFKYHGFHEDMILGWHVDSNIARRFSLVYGKVGDLGKEIYGYHCDHTRQVTAAHSHNRTENDWRVFVDGVQRPDIPEQAQSWGCPDDDIEEIRLDPPPTQIYVDALKKAIGAPLTQPTTARYVGETFNCVDYDPRHVTPFLADMFVASPRGIRLTWYGLRAATLRLFSQVWADLGFHNRVVLDREYNVFDAEDLDRLAVELVASADAIASADVFIFDFGGPEPLNTSATERTRHAQRILGMRRAFVRVLRAEHARMRSEQPPRRVLALNVIHNELERLVCQFLTFSLSPFSGRMRHGFVRPPSSGKQDWLASLHVGDVGVRRDSRIANRDRALGVFAYGPYQHLWAGTYRLSMRVEASEADRARWKEEYGVLLEVVSARNVFAVHAFPVVELDGSEREIIFEIPQHAADILNAVEARWSVLTQIEVSLRALAVEMLRPNTAVDSPNEDALRYANWLPYLHVGPAGRRARTRVAPREGDGAVADRWGGIPVLFDIGTEGFVVYGPYRPLRPGSYVLSIEFETDRRSPIGSAEVIGNDRSFGRGIVNVSQLTSARPFGAVERIGRLQRRIVRRLCRMLLALGQRISGRTGWAAPARIGAACLYWSELRGMRRYKFALPFQIPTDMSGDPPLIETQIWKYRESRGRLLTVAIEPIAAPVEWLPYLLIGPAGREDRGAVRLERGKEGYVVYGPYWSLLPGAYVMIATFENSGPGRLGKADVVAGDHVLAAVDLDGGQELQRLAFVVPADADAGLGPIETRIWKHRGSAGRLLSLTVRSAAELEGQIPVAAQTLPCSA